MAEDGSDDYAMAAVYKDVPCNLAQYGRQLEAQKEDRGYIIKTDLRLNLSPEYDLKPNDVISDCDTPPEGGSVNGKDHYQRKL